MSTDNGKCNIINDCLECATTDIQPLTISPENYAFNFDFDGTLNDGNVWMVIREQAISLITKTGRRTDNQSKCALTYLWADQITANDKNLRESFLNRTSTFEQQLWLALSVANVDLHNSELNNQLIANTVAGIRLRPGIRKYLNELVDRGFTTGIISFGIKEVIDQVLEREQIPVKGPDSASGVEVVATSITDWQKGNSNDKNNLTPIDISKIDITKLCKTKGITEDNIHEFGFTDEMIAFIKGVPVTSSSKGDEARKLSGDKKIIGVGDSTADIELLKVADPGYKVLVCATPNKEVEKGKKAFADILLALAGIKIVQGNELAEKLREMFAFE